MDVIQPPIDMEDPRTGVKVASVTQVLHVIQPPIDMEDRRTGVEVASVSQVLQVIQLQCLG